MPRAVRTLAATAVLLVVGLMATGPALAHSGFGGAPAETRFAFPPWAVFAAGALVVAATFAVVGAFLTKGEASGRHRSGHWPEPRPGMTWPRGVALVLLALAAANALLPGSDSLLPQTLLWLGIWALLPLLSYLLGDLWSRVSPFEVLRPERPRAAWPDRLGAWPATFLFLALIGAEVSNAAWLQSPVWVARLLLSYAVITMGGVLWFGAPWLQNVEVISRSLRWWATASPISWSRSGPRWLGFGRALERLPVHRLDDVAFTVALLYGVNFDGFLATPLGVSALEHLAWLGAPAPLWTLLALGFLAFFVVWLLAARSIRNASASVEPLRVPAMRFVAALLPIAVGYHLAHNVLYLAEHAPRFGLAVIDPLGLAGWPWFSVPLRLALPGSGSGWAALQVVLVLAGHVVAVVVGHHLAQGNYASRVQALRSEVPLTVIMVVYTWVGLWILSAAHGGGPA